MEYFTKRRTTVTTGDFNIPWSTMDRSSKQNINQNIVVLNNTIDLIDLIGIYRTFHPKEAKYTFFSNARGSCSIIDHIVGLKTSLNKFKNIEIITSIFSVDNGLTLERNIKEKLKSIKIHGD